MCMYVRHEIVLVISYLFHIKICWKSVTVWEGPTTVLGAQERVANVVNGLFMLLFILSPVNISKELFPGSHSLSAPKSLVL